MAIDRRDIEFKSDGTTCRAWHYHPGEDGDKPCVVMGHGFGATRECGLEVYADRFVELGLHCLVFDYRHFGASDGEPRQLLSIKRQLADWAAAFATARGLEGVDPDRVAAWGTSFGGGHALAAGVADGKVAAIVSQCPMMDGLAAFRQAIRYAGLWAALRLTASGVRDAVGSLIGARPRYLPAAAEPGTLAFMSTPDALPGYQAVAPPDHNYDVAARVALSVGFYRPFTKAKQLRCPMLLLICQEDGVAPPEAARKAARLGGDKVEVHELPIGHFDIYQPPHFDEALDLMTTFLKKHLLD